MSLKVSYELAGWLGFFVAFIFPILGYASLRRWVSREAVALWFFGMILVAWGALIVWRMFTVGIEMAYIKSLQDPHDEDYGMHDGVGGNAAILLFGWIPPTIVLPVYLTAEWIVRKIAVCWFERCRSADSIPQS